MIYNEIEFELDDGRKSSIYDIDSTNELANLKVGQTIEVDFGNMITECVVLDSQFGDYNIRGFLLSYKLRRI